MQVLLNNKTIRLNQKNVIGAGGEATIFHYQQHAVKVYLNPTPTRSDKLKDMLPLTQKLPINVLSPQTLVYDPKNTPQAIGFLMSLLSGNYTEVRALSTKKYRVMTGITNQSIGHLFLNIYHTLSTIHRLGMIVGDFNDLNLIFSDEQPIFIDVDSFQFGQHPCMVGTETFLDPNLYGIDLSQKPVYGPENDWYSFAVMLFKSLLLTHPYGGVHPTVNLLTLRAQQRITVFDSQVQYPKIAYAPALLSDDLAHEFELWFAQGKRDIFPKHLLQAYVDHLTVCPHCGATYPSNRKHCPQCSTVMMMPAKPISDAVKLKVLLETQGEIVFCQVRHGLIELIAHERDKAVFYRVDKHGLNKRLTLFNVLPNAHYAIIGDVLLISSDAESETIWAIDILSAPTGLFQTTSARLGGGRPIFGASGQAMYRMAGSYLLRGQIQHGQLIEQAVMSIADGQTWFKAAPESDSIFGFFRVFNQYHHWLFANQMQQDVPLPSLRNSESLLNIEVYFAATSLLAVRHTQYQGRSYTYLDEVTLQGKILHSQVTPYRENFYPSYMKGIIVYTSDQGVVQERLDNAQQTIFTQTAPYVRAGDTLWVWEDGVLTIQENKLVLLSL